MNIGRAREGLEKKLGAWEGSRGGEELRLQGRLLCVELRAGDGELGPGVEDFGGLDDDSISWGVLCRGTLLMLE